MAGSPSYLIHFGAVRLRINGSGNLKILLKSFDDVNIYYLTDLVLATTTNREALILSNYIDQRGRLHIELTEINESFNVSKIVVFTKVVATGYPQ